MLDNCAVYISANVEEAPPCLVSLLASLPRPDVRFVDGLNSCVPPSLGGVFWLNGKCAGSDFRYAVRNRHVPVRSASEGYKEKYPSVQTELFNWST